MQEPIFTNEARKLTLKKWGAGQVLNDTLLLKQMDKLALWLPALLSILVAVLIGQSGFKIGIVLVVLIWAIPITLLTIFDVSFGVLLVMVLSFVINFIAKRTEDIPVGLVVDILTALSFVGILLRQTRDKDWSFAKNKITVAVLVWMGYCFLQVANPYAASKLAWVYTIRSMAGMMVLYFLVLYAARSLRFVNRVIYIWLFFAFLGALYGLYQEFAGMPSYDLAWVKADELRFRLLFNWGRFRIFSFYSDPTVFGLLMAYTGVFCLALCMGSISVGKRVLLIVMSLLMFLAMVYSGTRTAYVALPIGIVFYSGLTFQRNILIFTGIFIVIGAGIIFGPVNSLGPISANSLNRIRSAFNPSEDNSYKAREKNQAFIQPFIQKHPIGGGLGSIGVYGVRFSPNSEMAKFPPDSGFVRVAVEMGWIGLLIYCYLFYITLRTGIENYFASKNPRIKNYLASILTVTFTLTVANFPQQSINIYPSMLVFYFCMALLAKLKDIEENESKHTPIGK